MPFIDKEKRKRKCTLCGEIRNKAEFHRLNKKKNVYATRCKRCERLTRKAKYQKYKDVARQKEIEVIRSNQEMIINVLQEEECVVCKESDYRSLHFVGEHGEEFKPNLRYKLDLTPYKVYCFNCIKVRKNKLKKPKDSRTRKYLETKKCLKCGNENLEVLLLYSETKQANPERLKNFIEAVGNFDILCANCYSKRLNKKPTNSAYQRFLKEVF